MTDTTDFAKLQIDPRGVARLTLDRPEVHNAFDDALIGELNGHLERLHALAERSEGRVVVARRALMSDGVPTPHRDGGGGILSGSGAV